MSIISNERGICQYNYTKWIIMLMDDKNNHNKNNKVVFKLFIKDLRAKI